MNNPRFFFFFLLFCLVGWLVSRFCFVVCVCVCVRVRVVVVVVLGNFPPRRKGVGKSSFKIGSNTNRYQAAAGNDFLSRRNFVALLEHLVIVTFKSCNCKGIL